MAEFGRHEIGVARGTDAQIQAERSRATVVRPDARPTRRIMQAPATLAGPIRTSSNGNAGEPSIHAPYVDLRLAKPPVPGSVADKVLKLEAITEHRTTPGQNADFISGASLAAVLGKEPTRAMPTINSKNRQS